MRTKHILILVGAFVFVAAITTVCFEKYQVYNSKINNAECTISHSTLLDNNTKLYMQDMNNKIEITDDIIKENIAKILDAKRIVKNSDSEEILSGSSVVVTTITDNISQSYVPFRDRITYVVGRINPSKVGTSKELTTINRLYLDSDGETLSKLEKIFHEELKKQPQKDNTIQ